MCLARSDTLTHTIDKPHAPTHPRTPTHGRSFAHLHSHTSHAHLFVSLPPRVPPRYDPVTGCHYYIDHHTKSTTWDRPTAPTVKAVADAAEAAEAKAAEAEADKAAGRTRTIEFEIAAKSPAVVYVLRPPPPHTHTVAHARTLYCKCNHQHTFPTRYLFSFPFSMCAPTHPHHAVAQLNHSHPLLLLFFSSCDRQHTRHLSQTRATFLCAPNYMQLRRGRRTGRRRWVRHRPCL